jgi:hypothetical protein
LFVIGGIVDHHCLEVVVIRFTDIPLNSDGQQFHQYQQNELQPPLNSDGHQFHQYQQNELQPPLILTH